jgi:hypothetical protein
VSLVDLHWFMRLIGYIVPETIAGTAEEALTRMAEKHDKILRENGLIK